MNNFQLHRQYKFKLQWKERGRGKRKAGRRQGGDFEIYGVQWSGGQSNKNNTTNDEQEGSRKCQNQREKLKKS